MKQVLIGLNLALGLLFGNGAFAEIREIVSMNQAVPWITQKTVVVLDVDNTVIEAKQTLGSDQFFEYLLARAKESGLSGQAAVDQALSYASQVQPITKVRPVEQVTIALIQALQQKGVATVALTARPIAWAAGTIQQLSSVGVDFRRSKLYRNDGPIGSDGRGWNVRGVLFMPPGGDKGTYLKEFLAASGVHADRVIFIDDKLRNVQSVDTAFNATQLNHVEFRYGAADVRVRAFDEKLAAFEWDYFVKYHVFLSDAEAYRLMGTVRNSLYTALAY